MNKNAFLRLAMWSGPRNISTAMMRSWGNRPDTFVCDEPLYAHYLQATGREHPGAAEVIAHGETDWRRAADWLTGPLPEGKTIFYQKHMTHHLLPGMERGWLGLLTHCFLIRHPAEVITSYLKKSHDPTTEDLGFVQQAEIYDWAAARAETPLPVLDARDVLRYPEAMLKKLCAALSVEFTPAMLVLGTRPAPYGRRVGQTLVSRSGNFHRLSPAPVGAGPRAGASARRLRAVPGGL